jgi:hypothetical protein
MNARFDFVSHPGVASRITKVAARQPAGGYEAGQYAA